ncbi:MAG: ABC transporter ATP-binding protein [Endomicrobiales bacterium]|nr:ABC transporter ATP-binding protein [Endomicrobiales bacterium]
MKTNGFAVTAKALTKSFGGFTAVDRVDLAVKKGEIFGFLGANGAGKSTTIRMLCGLLEPTSGDALVAGHSILGEPEEIKKCIGYMSQKFSLYNILSVRENMEFYSGVYGVKEEEMRKRTKELALELELESHMETMVGVLPPGIKQRVALACALVHKPEILFLDEPTAGVDPVLRRRFWEMIGGFSKSGVTVFVTTHYMDEVEHCHRIALMNEGRIIREGTTDELKKTTFRHRLIEIETDEVVKVFIELSRHAERIGSVSMHGAAVHVVPGRAPQEVKAEIEEILKRENLSHVKPRDAVPSMEDVFVKLIKGDD